MSEFLEVAKSWNAATDFGARRSLIQQGTRSITPQGGNDWDVDIRVQLPDGSVVRERKKAPVSGRTAVLRWAEARERVLVVRGKAARKKVEVKPVPTLAEFSKVTRKRIDRSRAESLRRNPF